MRSTTNHVHAWKSRQAALVALFAGIGLRAEGEDPVIVGYRTRQEDLVAKSNAILALADTEGRELAAQERDQIRDNTAEVERLEGEIDLRTRVAAQDAHLREPQPRRLAASSAEPLGTDARLQANGGRQSGGSEPHLQTTHISTAATRAAQRGDGGFATLGHFAQAVRGACLQPGNMDGRLRAALTTYVQEGVGQDGGFAVPADYRTEIMVLVNGEDTIYNRTDNMPTQSNTVNLTVDETSAWGTAGVQVYSRAEAAAMTQSKLQLKELSVRLNELYAFVPVTDETLDDAPLLARLLTTKTGQAINFKLNDWIVNGTGAGQFLGILKSPCLVTVAAEGSQTADTIHAKNIAKMWSRMPAAARAGAVWLCNQDAEEQLMQLGFQVGSPSGTMTGGIPLFMPPGGLSALPYATLMGKPVITTEACSALGDVGDIIFANLKGYFTPYKASGLKSDVSMHLFFDQGITCFRWTMRAGGQPWLSAAIARKSGSNTLSDFVTLAAR